ncbi:MAG TPA: bicyclomycin resistance protein [Microbacterium sp.]|nr:bicyclomycin resistance protein [Microbacterium sp.]
MFKTTRRLLLPAALITVGAFGLTACGSGQQANDASDGLLMWTLEVQPDRLATQQTMLDGFTAETGIEVELVPVEQDQVAQLMAAAALSNEMPDLLGSVPLGLVRNFDSEGYASSDISAAAVDALGADTFSSGALDLTSDGGRQLSVPSDAWAQILVYRTDLFDAAGLAAPTTYDTLLTAAETLTTGDQFGITLSTDPAGSFTQETFEAVALGNNCQLVNDDGSVALDSPECTAAIELYTALAQDYSPAGTQDVVSTRASYFAGQSAMIMWSTFLLDEMAGLRDDAAPSCDECTTSTWLAENSGIVPLITGPNAGDNAGSFGEMTSFVPTSAASPEETQQLIEYVMGDGYVEWFGMAPEGKFPVRLGTADNPTEFSDAWAELETGVDSRAALGDIYEAATIDTLTGAAASMSRWAFLQGQGEIVGVLSAELPIAKIIADAGSGAIDAATAQQEMVEAVDEIASR